MSSENASPGMGGVERRAWIAGLVIAALVLLGRLTPYQPVQDFFDSFSWLTRQALRIAERLFESYGYLTVFLAPLTENTIFLGAIVPGLLVMMLAGLGAHDGLIDIWRAVPLAIAGAWIGDTVSYGIGRFGWQRLGPESRLVKMTERMREPLLAHSTWVVLLYHFAGYSRTIGPAASGFLRIPFRRWLLLDYAGSAVWVVVFMSLGYLLGVFGLSLDATESNVRVIELILFGLGALALVALLMRSSQRTTGASNDADAAG